MRKYLGLLLIIVGSLIFLANFFPDYGIYLSQLQVITSVPFWGVVFVLAGGYFALKNEKAKAGLGVLLVLFVVVYLLGAAGGAPSIEIGGWTFPSFFSGGKKTAGEVRTMGEYEASRLEISDIAAKIVLSETDGEKTEVSTNLPVSTNKTDDKVLFECNSGCKEYKNGELVLKVGKEQQLKTLIIKDTVGDVSLNLSQRLEIVTMKDFVGSLEGERFASDKMELKDFIGDVSLSITSLNQFEASNGIGDVKITLPENYRVELKSESLLSRLNSEGDIHQGDQTMEFEAKNMIGQVTINKPDSG
ncbi:hypothetical protein KGY71_07245 [Candidatus Bipolaricaulota bacterium]|nr:hypothetical protein [Candidatus Bipolaricaulota bacterium]